MTHDFREDYEVLALDERADWERARLSYRRQVNRWHPDRFAERPRERIVAQQRFIQLTRSFDNLRTFYRLNHRLPFEPIRAAPKSEEHGAPAPVAGEEGTGSAERPRDAAVLDAGMLSPRQTARSRSGRGRNARLGWLLSGTLVVLGTLAAFVVLDYNARQATLEEGREVLRRTEPSEYMPSAAEVQRRSSRGAFIEREDSGRIGDQLMEDIFR